MSAATHFLKSLWGVVALTFGSFFVLVLIIVIFGIILYCMCRRTSHRRGYTRVESGNRHNVANSPRGTMVNLQQPASSNDTRPGQGEEGLYEALQRQRTEQDQARRESALLNCQFYLRSNPGYLLDTQLPDIGSRMSKSWFIVRQIRGTTPILLTLIPVSQQCRINLIEDKPVLKRLIRALEHMNIHKIIDIDYIADRRLVVVLEPLHTRGSLKDLLYQTTPNLSWSTKYSVRRTGLRLKQIQSLGRQVLEAVLFLHNLGFKPLGQIQSGNIYVDGGMCRLSGYENQLLGYKPRIHRLVKPFKEKIDSALFGHLLFELSSGRELSVSRPSDTDLSRIRYDPVVEVLRFIFNNNTGEIPELNEILEHQFFSAASSSGLDHWSYEGVRLDEDMKALIVKSRKGRLYAGSGASAPTAGRKKHKTSSPKYPVFNPSKSSTLSTIAQSPNGISEHQATTMNSKARSSNNQSKQSQLQSPVGEDAPPPSEDRSALLGQIRVGTTLRKTETNDRSAPILS